MHDNFYVRKAAVLGAGVMGAQIAAHFGIAGIPVVLYDLKANSGSANDLIKKAVLPCSLIRARQSVGTPCSSLIISPKPLKGFAFQQLLEIGFRNHLDAE